MFLQIEAKKPTIIFCIQKLVT